MPAIVDGSGSNAANTAVLYASPGVLPAANGAALTGVNPVTVTTYTSGSGNWTKPSTGTFAFVQVWSGGGSGGKSVATTSVGAAGGGGGGYAEALYLLSSLANTVAYSVGAGGAAVTATVDTNGNAGGNSTFGSITVYGGTGGLSGSGDAPGGSWYGRNVGGANRGMPWDGGMGTNKITTSATADLYSFAGGGAGGGWNSNTTPIGPGTSALGGNGGAGSNAVGGTAGSGVEPGGGGGTKINGTTGSSGAGGNGRIVIWTW